MYISFDLLNRLLERAEELLSQPELPPALKTLYAARLKEPSIAFRASQAALIAAEDGANKERREVRAALEGITQPYRFVRALVAGHVPDFTLPEALGVLKTDTDKKLAIESLLHRIDASAGEPWAAELAASEFAGKAPEVIREINEDIAARSTLSKAVEARIAAFGVAYDAFLAFRAAVRAGVGPSSTMYRRLAPTYRRGEVDEAGTPSTDSGTP